MDQHTWTDPLCGECRAFPSTADSILGAMAREVVRLAQREADLLEKIDHMDAQMVGASRDHERQRDVLLNRIQVLERENREKCLELAEKAGRIRELEEQLAGEVMENHALKMTVEEGSEIEAELAGALAAGHGEDLRPCKAPCPGHLGPKASAAVDRAASAWRRLEAAVEDGIAHVERARQAVLDSALGRREELGVLGRQTMEQLDLAHEALSGAGTGGAPAPDREALALRVKALEADLRFIQAHAAVAVAHSGLTPPAGPAPPSLGVVDRVAAIEQRLGLKGKE